MRARLEPFQRRILQAVGSGVREAVILLPRGNGKTSLMALIALHHLATVEDARVVVAASSRAQASNLFAYAQQYARQLDNPHIAHRWLVLRWCPEPGARRFTRGRSKCSQPTPASCTDSRRRSWS